jgi:dolichyl-phosphate-mannose--protein O-mannosyl transferase
MSSLLKLRSTQFLAIVFSILLSITATMSAGFNVKMYQPWVTMLSWGGAIAMITFAGWEKKPAAFKLNWKILGPASIVFLVAFFVRGVDTVHIPIVLSGDESSSGIHAIHYLNGDMDNLFIGGWYSFPSMFFLFQSIGIRLLGHTTEGLRIPAAIIGALTVAVLYLIIRNQFGKRQALLTAGFLAFSHFHINFSRIGLNNIWDGLAFVVVLGALWWGWKSERRAAFLLSGLTLGFSMYLYTSARGLLIVIPVWLIWGSRGWRRRLGCSPGG